MSQTQPKSNVLLGVTGGIAAYKSCELTSSLIKSGFDVRVVMTRAAMNFVGPTSFAAITGNPVSSSMFDPNQENTISHIDLARWADLLVVAPATANFLAKAARGIADDLLSTIYLATRAPLLIAPAMNPFMWDHAATRANVDILNERGTMITGPACGRTACGEEGPGRMSEPGRILERIQQALGPKDLDGQVIVITAGPTREHLDPVRYISNPSTGRMGMELARAAQMRGAQVHLVLGPTQLEPPGGVHVIHVVSAAEMHQAVMYYSKDAKVVIKSAAVSDFKPIQREEHKVKKTDQGSDLIQLEGTKDILAELGANKGDRLLVGFAAETRDLVENAVEKLKRKNLDLLIANKVGEKDTGFAAKTNQAHILDADGGHEELPLMEKSQMANHILDRVAKLLGLGEEGDA
jgi:phosphopantothenoylcysteine decarboxylase/phosphopantothenate--cysteine ligase